MNLIRELLVLMMLLTPLAPPKSNWIEDPSSQPLSKEDGRGERFRLLADFNADGIQDIALSDDLSEWGKAGIDFTLYISDGNGKFCNHGRFFAHIKAVSLEKYGSVVRIWTYHRNGPSGLIGYNEVQKKKLSEFHSIEIHPGDGREISNGIYNAVFPNSDLPIRVEESVTTGTKVVWLDYYRGKK